MVTAVAPSTLTAYVVIGDPPVFIGADQVAVIVVEVTLPNTRSVGESGMVGSVDSLPVSAAEDPAPLTTVTENACDVPGARPLAVCVVVVVHVSGPPSIRTW